MEVLGVFRDIESAAQGVEALVKAGFAEGQITSLTAVPYPDGVLVKTERHSWLRWLALAGGLVGVGAGVSLAAGTAWLYPVQTGDKPIIALYPAAIIVFEIAMLCAIVGTVVGMFLEMRLPPRERRLYDPAIAEGYIGIDVTIHPGGEVVPCPDEAEACVGLVAALSVPEQMTRAKEIMKQAGAVRTVTE